VRTTPTGAAPERMRRNGRVRPGFASREASSAHWMVRRPTCRLAASSRRTGGSIAFSWRRWSSPSAPLRACSEIAKSRGWSQARGWWMMALNGRSLVGATGCHSEFSFPRPTPPKKPLRPSARPVPRRVAQATGSSEPTILLVGADSAFEPALRAALSRHRVYVETTTTRLGC